MQVAADRELFRLDHALAEESDESFFLSLPIILNKKVFNFIVRQLTEHKRRVSFVFYRQGDIQPRR